MYIYIEQLTSILQADGYDKDFWSHHKHRRKTLVPCSDHRYFIAHLQKVERRSTIDIKGG